MIKLAGRQVLDDFRMRVRDVGHGSAPRWDDPVTVQCYTTQHVVHAEVHPLLAAVLLHRGCKAHGLPLLHQALHVHGVHGAVSQQEIVVPDPSSQQGLVVQQTLFPASRVLAPDRLDGHDEIDELGVDAHGDSPSQGLDAGNFHIRFGLELAQ